MSRHTISHATDLFWGDAQWGLAESGARGVRMNPIYQQTWTSPAGADADALVTKVAVTTGATTVLTMASTVTGAGLSAGVKTLDVPRNVTITTSDLALGGGTISVVVKGTDAYGATMWERFNVTVSDVTVSGKKAFKTITAVEKIAATASGTLYVGIGNRLGLNYRLSSVLDVVAGHSGTIAATGFAPSDFVLPTYTATETHSASAAVTGFAGLPRDVRGTWKPATALDAAVSYSLWYKVNAGRGGGQAGVAVDGKFEAYGIDQAAT